MEKRVSNINQVFPQGTNSTMFTSCCDVAICDYEAVCPRCGNKVIGWDAECDYKRGRTRWEHATATWKRKKL